MEISVLMIGTLGVVLALAVFLLVRYYAKNDSHPMKNDRERNIGEIRREGPTDA